MPRVMLGLGPSIHDFQDVDGRNKSGHDGRALSFLRREAADGNP